MPSFSLRRNRLPEGENDVPNSASGDAIDNSPSVEKVQSGRRKSKRDFFRRLLRGTTLRSTSQASNRENVKLSEQPMSPAKSIPDSTKPLPVPPISITNATTAPTQEPAQPADPPKKLNRIITTLTLPDIQNLFSGAPQFFVRSEGAHTGAPNPSVAFPWNKELYIRDLSDHSQIEDQAWRSITAKQHITRDFSHTKDSDRLRHEKLRAHFAPKCHERPNMLSMQGLERGTIGFAAALELGVADSLKEDAEPPLSPDAEPLAERRDNFLNEKQGVRPMDQSTLISRLADISAEDSVYDSTLSFAVKTTVDLYTELFTQVLFPPSRVTDSNDPYSLFVQIEALIDVLATPHVWIDFSLVEWRIRLGQILWSEPFEPDEIDQVNINGETVYDSGSQQFWLLLQILLSCELLVRLDIVTKKAEKEPNIITAEEIRRFERDATPSVRWSMILARIWLENIYIDEIKVAASPQTKKPAAGWLATLTGLAPAQPVETHTKLDLSIIKIKHPMRQVSGLIHFARKLHWPQIESLAAKFSEAKSGTDSALATPTVGTPFSMTTQRSSYFGSSGKPGLRRSLSAQLSTEGSRAAVIRPEGWLSRSYLSGLILPGEGINHFLIATLLENDDNAMARIGDNANLYGGFVYMNKSFWSTACIVGRILAAGKGASECMGWMSCDVIPKGMGDGWVNIEVELEPDHGEEGNDSASARIWKKALVEKEGHVLGDGDADTLFPGDFSLPDSDVQDTENLEVKLTSLELFASVDSGKDTYPTDENVDSTPMTDTTELHEPEIKDYVAMMRFSVTHGHGEKEMDFALEHNVHFVTAHPCVPSKHGNLLQSPTSPPFRFPTSSLKSGNTSMSPHDLFSGHALHKFFTYKREFFSHIIIPSLIRKDSKSQHPLESLHTSSTDIFIIDCTEPTPPLATPMVLPTDVSGFTTVPALGSGTELGRGPEAETVGITSAVETVHITRKRRFGSDMEMMARAWCSEKGYNAIISRKGRNCIACSVREAKALGWKIVLRFG